MRILVTGGAGFIGSHLCDYLLAKGHSVIAMDNLMTGSIANIEHLAGNERFKFIKHDVTEYIYVDGPIDAVMHLASLPSPIDFERFPIQILKVGALGTHKALGLAKGKGAKFLLASTSEVYGDPLIHPQSEDYWGNVNPVGPRGVYDESKRFAEALTMAYHRHHRMDTRIARIFNSVLADEMLCFFNDDKLHLEAAAKYAERLRQSTLIRPHRLLVPAFDPETGEISLRQANAFIGHPAIRKDAYEVHTRYGRRIRVTGDHSLFKRDANGRPVATPVRELKVGDYIAIPGQLPVIEKDVTIVNLGQQLIERAETQEALWDVALMSPSLRAFVAENRPAIEAILMESGRGSSSCSKRNTVGCSVRKYIRCGILPLYVIARWEDYKPFFWPEDGFLRPHTGGGNTVPNFVHITDGLLWLAGFYMAGGSCHSRRGTHCVSFCSDERYLDKAQALLQCELKVQTGRAAPTATCGPTLYVHSSLLVMLFRDVLELGGSSAERRIPRWIMQLPLIRVKHFLEGYRQGDGIHSGKSLGNELAFNTISERLAIDLTYLLLRFGLVASVDAYKTTCKRRCGERKSPFHRVTVCDVDNFDILSWDKGVRQTLNATRWGDIVWAPVKHIQPIPCTEKVYDFSVPDAENFLAGNGVMAKNTYGPRMRADDGRVVPTFINQALRGEPLTVFGNGSQTRSFCYVSDMVEGIYRLLMSDVTTPVNLGNPGEMTILDFARAVIEITGSRSQIMFKDLPQDDPKVRRPDISKAKRELGWQPTVPLEEGLRHTVEYFKTKLGTARYHST